MEVSLWIWFLLLGGIIEKSVVVDNVFIAGGSWLISSFAWVLYIFGAFLIATGIRLLMQRNDHLDISQSRTLELFRMLIPTTDEYEGQNFLTRHNGVLMETPLFADLVHRFIYLKIGLSLVLVWVGIKMFVGHGFFNIPTAISLGVVIAFIAISVVASSIATREPTKSHESDRKEEIDA
jgi:tellurite resistance protein TerC